MTFEIAAGETVRTVTVARKGHLLQVVIGDRTLLVDARRVGDLALSLLVQREGTGEPVQSVDAALAA